MLSSKGLLILCALLVAWFLVSCKASKEQQPAMANRGSSKTPEGSNAMVENRSRIMATVLEVVPSTEPKFYLRLRIESVEAMAGYENLAKAGQIIEAYPNFRREEGQELDYTTEGNKHLLEAEDLKPGDELTATVYYRENSVLLMDWQRH